MKESIQNKLHTLIDRHEEVAGLLADWLPVVYLQMRTCSALTTLKKKILI